MSANRSTIQAKKEHLKKSRNSLKPSKETVDYVKNIQNAVLASSLSCKELEEKSGIPSGTLNRILNAHGNMKLDHAVRLSQAISMEVAEMVHFKPTHSSDTEFLNQIARWGKRIPADKRSLVIELLRALSKCD